MKKILQPTRVKIICDVLLSLAGVLVAIFLPSSVVSGAFAQLSVGQKILSFFASFIISFVFYYPLAAGLVYLVGSIKKSTYVFREIIWAVIFIVIFNPLTLSVVLVKLSLRPAVPQSGQAGPVLGNEAQNSNQPICGLTINDFAAGSKIEAAGIRKGEIILRLNGAQINSVQDIFDQLADKKPGDQVILETDQGAKSVELVPNASDPNRPALGVKLAPNPCK